MSDASKSWTIKNFEQDGTTTVRRGVSNKEAIGEIYRLMGGAAAKRKPAAPIKLRRTETAEKVAA